MSISNIVHYPLDNGLNIILENIPHRISAVMGIWIPIGSRMENDTEMGFSHFTEHMLFKGTKKRKYQDISREIDRLGGYMNASTSKEVTSYYISINSKYTETALDVLSDIFFNSVFAKQEFDLEKQVILEEIKMSEDTPDDHLFDLFYHDFFGDTPLGRPIAGTLKSIGNCKRDELFNFYTSKYGANGSVLSLAGRLWENDNEKKSIKKTIEKLFNQKNNQLTGSPAFQIEKPSEKTPLHVKHYQKKLEQTHFAFGLPGISRLEENDAYAGIFTHLMGGTMSSKLFQKLREENGLCYAVSTFHSQFFKEGLWGVYCGTSSQNFNQAVDLMIKEIKNALNGDIPETEINETRNGLAAAMELSMESASRRADYNARSVLYFKKARDWRDRIKKIENTKADDVIIGMNKLWQNKNFYLCSLGDMKKNNIEKEISKKYKSPFI
ncbi:MAG: insulinase family protein [Spirochaetia bacterium]|nr:insulinase family protein [Spirochaetia bacterium]